MFWYLYGSGKFGEWVNMMAHARLRAVCKSWLTKLLACERTTLPNCLVQTFPNCFAGYRAFVYIPHTLISHGLFCWILFLLRKLCSLCGIGLVSHIIGCLYFSKWKIKQACRPTFFGVCVCVVLLSKSQH